MRRWIVLVAFVVQSSAAVAIAETQATCEGTLCCHEWAVDVRDASGTKWGLTIGDTPDQVRERFAQAAAFDRSFCRFVGKPSPCTKLEHVSAGPLRCFGGGGATAKPDAADLCAHDVLQRTERLEQRFAAQKTRLEVTHRTVESLRILAAAVAPASAFGQPLQVLGSFGVALNDATARARRIKEVVGFACQKPNMDALTETSGALFWAGGRYGVVNDPVATLYGPAWATGKYGGHDEQARDRAETLDQLTDLERVGMTELPTLPLVTVAIPSSGLAVLESKTRKGNGRLVITDLGVVDAKQNLSKPEVTAVFLFTRKDGSAGLGTVTITHHKTSKREVITLVGAGGGDAETLVITVERPEDEAETPVAKNQRPAPVNACGPRSPFVQNDIPPAERARLDAIDVAWKVCAAHFYRDYAVWAVETKHYRGATPECMRTYIANMDEAIRLYQANQTGEGDDYMLSSHHRTCVNAAEFHLGP